VEEIAKESAATKENYGTNHDTHDDDNSDFDISSPIMSHKSYILLADIASQIGIDLGCSLDMIETNLDIMRKLEKGTYDILMQ
jgi:hypothetical protein